MGRSPLIVVAAILALAFAYTVPGVSLLAESIERSWFPWTPPGSTVPRTEFQPYWATFFPSLILVGMGVGAAVTSAIAIRVAGGMTKLLMAFGGANLAAGLALFVHSLSYMFIGICVYSVGCRWEIVPLWPALLPAIAMTVVGIALIFISRRGYLAGARGSSPSSLG